MSDVVSVHESHGQRSERNTLANQSLVFSVLLAKSTVAGVLPLEMYVPFILGLDILTLLSSCGMVGTGWSQLI